MKYDITVGGYITNINVSAEFVKNEYNLTEEDIKKALKRQGKHNTVIRIFVHGEGISKRPNCMTEEMAKEWDSVRLRLNPHAKK